MLDLDDTDELYRIRLIACDMDGTLLQNGRRTPSDEAFELIGELWSRGVIFLPASGRQYSSLRYLFKPVQDKMAFLCDNGSMVMYHDTPVVRRGFSRLLGLRIAHVVNAYSYATPMITTERHCYTLRGYDEFTERMKSDLGAEVLTVDAPEEIDEDILKVAFQVSSDKHVAAERYFEDEFGPWVNIMTSGATWSDIVPRGTDKGVALRAFGALMGIAPQQMAAFGDNHNDYGMLSLVGHPYLMETCNPSMRGLVHDAIYVPTVEGELRRLLDTPGLLGRA